MAGTRKPPRKTKASDRAPSTAGQRDWSPEALIRAVVSKSDAERIAIAKAAGILTSKGKLAKKYKSWGNRVSMTPEVNAKAK